MKNKHILMSLVALFIFGCTTSDDDPQIQSVDQSEISPVENFEAFEYMLKLRNSDKNIQYKGGNNETGVQFVSMYSDFFDDYMIYATFWIPGTLKLVYASYPTNGEDEAKVNGDWIMGNWTLREPRVFIIDFSGDIGVINYSNWCEEEKAGYYHQSSRGKLETHDFNGDGQIDVWRYDPHDKDSDVQGQGRTVLTDGQIYDNWPFFPTLGNCRDATTEVDLSWNIHIKNGNWDKTVVLDGITYKN